MGPAPLLYIHPRGHLNDLVIPAGALACLNGLSVRRVGRYSFEVAADQIRAARVIAIDVHWALALPGAAALLDHVRRLSPEARVIAGGITAGHYAREMVDVTGFDFAIRGDSEVAFAALVEALLDGRDASALPNVYARLGALPAGCAVAHVQRAGGGRLLYLPVYPPLRSIPLSGSDPPPAAGADGCLHYVRTSLCAMAEGRPECNAVERGLDLERVAEAYFPAVPSYDQLPYDGPEVVGAVFRVRH